MMCQETNEQPIELEPIFKKDIWDCIFFDVQVDKPYFINRMID